MVDSLIQPSLAQDPNLVTLTQLAERITYLDVTPVITHDIDRVTPTALPHLADQFHMRHTVAWRRAQTDAERRGLVKSAIARHRIKGTLAGFRLAAQDAGAKLVRAIVPPAKIFAGAALTLTERNAFIQRYPQLRIYPQRLAGQRIGAMVQASYAGQAYPVQSDAALRLAPRAFLFRDGQETALELVERVQQETSRTARTVTEVCVSSQAGPLAFCGRICRWPARTDAAARMYRMVAETPYIDSQESLRHVALRPGLEPLTVRYDWIAGLGHAQGVHADRFVAGHLVRSTARERIYKRMWLFDPDLDVTRRGAVSYCDSARLSMPAYHAELSIQMSSRTHPRVARRFVQGYLAKGDLSDWHDSFDALRDVARAADRISINTAVIRPAVAGESQRAGAVTAGDWRIR